MKRRASLAACILLLASPAPLLACGGCTDAVLLMTLPWAGFGGLFLWAWIFTMLGVRERLRRRSSDGIQALVRGSTLVVFAILGSVGYVVLAFLTMGSLLFPSLVVGFVWAVYLMIRLAVDLFRVVYRKDSHRRIVVLINSVFAVGVLTFVAFFQTKAGSLEHQVSSLRYGHHTPMYSKIMPEIVARGEEAVGPLIHATSEALGPANQ